LRKQKHRIIEPKIKILTSYAGSVTVLAGSGKIEYQDGLGSNASFCYPTGITLFYRIFLNPFFPFWLYLLILFLAGIAIDQESGNIFVSDYNNHAIRMVTPQGKNL
jgi:hypothetical protein